MRSNDETDQTRPNRRRQLFKERGGGGRGNYIGCPETAVSSVSKVIRSQAAESETWIYFAKFLKFKIAFYAKETTDVRVFKFEHGNRNDTV